MSTYSDQLKDPRWQKKRLLILERDNWTCQWCQDKEKTLHIHHLKYSGDPWDVDNKYLLTLCEDCHLQIDQDYEKAGKKLVAALKSKAFAAEHLIKLAKAIEEGSVCGLPDEPNTDIIGRIFTDEEKWNLISDGFYQDRERDTAIEYLT